jgi:uncharacterized small protein (DUF1192 family)
VDERGRLAPREEALVNPICQSIALLLASFLVALPTLAEEQENANRPLVEEVLELYGVKEQVSQVPALLQAQLERERAEHAPGVYSALRDAFAHAYEPEKLYQKVIAHFESNSNREQLLAARKWLETPLSQKMTRLEVAAGRPEAQQEMQEFSAQLDANPPEPDRLSLVQELDDSVGASENTIAISVATVEAVVKGVQPLLPPDRRMPESEIEHQVERLQAQLKATMKYSTWLAFLYTYRSATNQELEEYLAYWRSGEGRWLSQTASAALLEAITAAAEEAGKRIAEAATRNRAAIRSN